MHIGIPSIFCKFQFSSQAIHATLLERQKENGLKTSKRVIVTTLCFLKTFMS